MALVLLLLFFATCSISSPHHQPVDLQKCSRAKFDLSDLDSALHTYRECTSLLESLPSEASLSMLKTLHEKMDLAWANLASKEGHQVVRRALAQAVEEGITADDVAVWAVSADLGDTEAEVEQHELNAPDDVLPSNCVAEFIADTYNILMVWSMTSLVVLASLLFCASYFLLKASRTFAKRVKKRTCVPPKRTSQSSILQKNKKKGKIPPPPSCVEYSDIEKQ